MTSEHGEGLQMSKEIGEFSKNVMGVWNYYANGDLSLASCVRDALSKFKEEYVDQNPAMFWFKDVPSPIYAGDTEKLLLDRWIKLCAAGTQAQIAHLHDLT